MRTRIVAAAMLLAAAPAAAQTVAIEGGTVYTAAGAPIRGGTVLIQDGRISAVGAGIAIPAGAVRIDARGKWVTPGLFESSTNLGLVEVGGVQETNDFRMQDTDRVAAGFNVADGLNPRSMVIPVTRIAGVTTAVSRPTGGLIAGQGVLLDLDGSRVETMLIRNPAGMWASIGENARDAGHGARGGIIMRLREVLEDAKAYGRNPASYDRGESRELSVSRLDLQALQPVLAGRLPLVVEAHRAADIQEAIRVAREYGLKLIISGGTEGWMVAQDLAAAHVPVIVKVLNNLPASYEALGARYENAALLRRAGVQVAITSGETFKAYNIRQEAGNAVAYGLPWEEAFRAVTLYPAQIWGVADRYGSLEPGKVANVVVWDGDPLELLTRVEHVFIRGREIPLVSRETQLRDRYRHLDDSRAYRQ
ncbi:amidohydrolase family protein [Longimicrobium sp.]|uniref:amidohydrolase family protein n=1 Tax=Longimicrobium sp. TaxID=2029185 RepID=UPI002BE0037A|nr:amidohydrolase family protein [Longimicrobium sp.]HSU13324.1 amidohydrolase family protein [Longimicrobium sp.]